MIPRHPQKRIQIRRFLFATQFIFLVTKILVSVLVTGDFISLMIQSFAIFVFLAYVPWALVCDFRTAKEVRLEWERIRRIRRGEDLDHVGESHLEKKGMKNRWRSDRAWQECLFLTLQGLCWLVSAIFAGIQGGPQACQQVVLQNAIISGLDRLVPDDAASQFCDGMTANIALSCLGVVFTLAWLWWVYYSVKTLRKFEKTTREDGQEVLIVREKVWQKSMARLLRRDEDDDVNGIKRIVTGGLIDLIEMESRRGSLSRGRSFAGNRQGFVRGANTPRPSHESSVTSLGGHISVMAMRNTSPVTNTNTDTMTMSSGPPYEPTPRNTNDIIQSLAGGPRSDMPPPPYIGQPANEGTHNTTSSSGTGTGTGTGTTGSTSMSLSQGHSTANESPLTHPSHLTTTSANQNRPLPLAPPQIERVVERKMDEMAGTGTGTTSGVGVMDAFTATRLGLGPVIGAGQMGEKSLEGLVDRKLDSFTQTTSSTGPSIRPTNVTGGETMEQLVDRKITWAGETVPSGSGTGSGSRSSSYPYSANPYPITTNRSSPHTRHETHPHPTLHRIHPESYNASKGKAAEAGFAIQNPSSPSNSSSPITANTSGEITLEEMIELKMASLRSQSKTSRPGILELDSGGELKKKKKRKSKGKGRARAGSDPGPKLERFEESDEDESD